MCFELEVDCISKSGFLEVTFLMVHKVGAPKKCSHDIFISNPYEHDIFISNPYGSKVILTKNTRAQAVC